MSRFRFRLGALSGALLALALSLLPAGPLAAQQQPAATGAAPPATVNGYVPEFGTMWTFEAAPLEYWKARYGFTPDQAWLDHVRLASVRLPGCSSSFVSPKGLVMTNHHCARSCISSSSPADTNYQRTGFVARTEEEEKKCAGLYVDQLISIDDVTARIRGKATAAGAAQQVAQRDAEIAAIEGECKQSTGMTCQVVTLYQGGMYSLYRYKRYDDVRLVMAPEEEISFFGGDPDNFTYPRYDLDLTLLRVYENGRPRPTEHFLKWSAAGAKEGDLVLVTGNPGSTGRLLTMAQMEYLRDVQYPAQLAGLAMNIGIYQKLSEAGEEQKRKYENQLFSAQNAQKAITGYRRGLLDSTIMARKQRFEQDFRARIAADAKLQAQYGGAWGAIASAQQELKSFAPQLRYYSFGGSTLLNAALALVRLPQQAALPDSARLPSLRGPAMEAARKQLAGDLPVDTALERMQIAGWLAMAQKELGASDPLVRTLLAGRTPEAAAAALVSGTRLGDAAVRGKLLEGGARAIAASKDPLLAAVRTLEPKGREHAERAARLAATVSANAEKVGQAIFAAYGTNLPPDATFTLRISDGVMKSYPYNGTVAGAKTTFYGLWERSAQFDDEAPWHIPERWKRAQARLDMATPYNFVTTNDIIGGNSGSPMINRDAEVVGLVFDGNIEMLPNRFIFTDEVSRAVGVHSRAIPEALRKVYEAPRIADELEGGK